MIDPFNTEVIETRKKEGQLIQAYPDIKAVTLAAKNQIENVIFWPLPSLEDVTYEDGSIETADLNMTPAAAFLGGKDLLVSGYGFSGKLWQLDIECHDQIINTMKKGDLV